jgi:O-acetyl-ADP-ribose deacetylase (regulator of RNase III)
MFLQIGFSGIISAMITLQAALEANQAVLGTQFKNLGRTNRVYLSYGANGWSVKDFSGFFGHIQEIFRRYLGCYASTHRLNVLKGIKTITVAEKNAISASFWARLKAGNLGLVAPTPHTRTIPSQPAPIKPDVTPISKPSPGFRPDPAIPNLLTKLVGTACISIEQGDITQTEGVQAIVNAAKQELTGGGGVDGAIHKAAGRMVLWAENEKIPPDTNGVRCKTGNAVITNSGQLIQIGIRKVIHAVGPVYNRGNPKESADLLKQTYLSALKVAQTNGIRKIAFPAISTGIYGYPFGDATQLAIQTIEEYAVQNPATFDKIKLIFPAADYHKAADLCNTK